MAMSHTRWLLMLLLLYLIWWIALAIDPWYREDWLLENILVFIGVPVAIHFHRELSRFSLACLFLFFVLHAIGAHYTYSMVPYDAWMKSLSGHTVSELLGLERNHYDRLVHFLYGLLVTPTFVELIDQRVQLRGTLAWLLPFSFMSAHSALFELIEWAAAEVFGGELGQAYVGTQGDVWDAQKDSALAILGSLIAVVFVRWVWRRPRQNAPIVATM